MVMVMKIRSDHGASAVEFALVLPVLMLLTFGIIEFGVLLFDKAVITNASREGARFGIVFVADLDGDGIPDRKDETTIESVITGYANDLLINLGSEVDNLSPGDIETTWTTNANGDTDLTVTVRFTYDFLVLPNLSSLVEGSFATLNIPLVGQTIMRME